jgi:hypothetical protein
MVHARGIRLMLMFPKPTREKKKRAADRRPGMSPSHLDRVRGLPCCVCECSPRVQAHHLKDTPDKERGMGLRSTDQHALPMCWECHGEVERIGSKNELAWFDARGIDARGLAQALWRASSAKGEKMLEVFRVHMKAKAIRQ